jgi:hypothetical protein
MQKGYLFYSSVKRLLDKYAYFNTPKEYEMLMLELAKLFKI